MQAVYSIQRVDDIVEFIMRNVDTQIQKAQLMKSMPNYLARQCFELIYQNILPVAFIPLRNYLIQQTIKDIPKIDKESLMPKEVDKDIIVIQMGKSLLKATSIGRKKMSSLSRSSFHSPRLSNISVSQSNRKSIRETKPKNQCEILKFDIEQQDPQSVHLRQLTEMRLNHQLQYRKLTLERQKNFKQKSQILSKFIEENPNICITHEYTGQQIKSAIADEKIKHYMMKAAYGQTAKRYQNSFDGPQSLIVQVSRNSREKDDKHKTIRAMEMPKFPMQIKDFTHAHEIKNYKLQDYKKNFGRKFSRLDQYSKTLDVSIYKDEPKDDIFSSRKHLRDSTLAEQSSKMCESRHVRRLALPRLHGRYKVLDRYQQV